MPRRAPPTSLRLVSGPIPPRSGPRHTLPSVPLPAFHPITLNSVSHETHRRAQGWSSWQPWRSTSDLTDCPETVSPVDPDMSSRSGSPKSIRGPWDHSRTIPLPFDVENLLAAPKPVAISPTGWRHG
ncbi:hypothetical protein BD779DRAFT_838153 [Infundibulicybe gibba]|nr:hypothetical protein BD779DRAFT_838153 [Infundibulicybe gibba]